MGLKKSNYESKKLGMTIPEAYAVIRKIRVENGNGIAEIAVQTTREKALNLSPIEREEVTFRVDRNESPYITAYKAAKGQRTERRWNLETRAIEEVTVDMPFRDWSDDITEGE